MKEITLLLIYKPLCVSGQMTLNDSSPCWKLGLGAGLGHDGARDTIVVNAKDIEYEAMDNDNK